MNAKNYINNKTLTEGIIVEESHRVETMGGDAYIYKNKMEKVLGFEASNGHRGSLMVEPKNLKTLINMINAAREFGNKVYLQPIVNKKFAIMNTLGNKHEHNNGVIEDFKKYYLNEQEILDILAHPEKLLTFNWEKLVGVTLKKSKSTIQKWPGDNVKGLWSHFMKAESSMSPCENCSNKKECGIS